MPKILLTDLSSLNQPKREKGCRQNLILLLRYCSMLPKIPKWHEIGLNRYLILKVRLICTWKTKISNQYWFRPILWCLGLLLDNEQYPDSKMNFCRNPFSLLPWLIHVRSVKKVIPIEEGDSSVGWFSQKLMSALFFSKDTWSLVSTSESPIESSCYWCGLFLLQHPLFAHLMTEDGREWYSKLCKKVKIESEVWFDKKWINEVIWAKSWNFIF